ncbi:MAG TPA: TIGR03557 family F420-dependent LLM class oxidoreductase [Solirubrobacteraceae bacterium]|jgi:G6PDH family F420-dependent oxidoreductase|nr:TIGR03557 family F420-dependent LLM class oxidoreductase [Solirubrobacteraceae bacterium]
MKIGYFLSSEEFAPQQLIEQARRAEQAGFHALWISDHYHPWNDEQGHSPFVWSVIGALAEATSLPVTTGVTCPTVRIHPAIIAQAAATSRVMHPGRFQLGVGSGEALNEHILGDRWPEADVRLEMLEEAVEVIRLLWQGGQRSHHGRHYTVENARVYDLPDDPPPILVSGFGPKAIRLAAQIGDGFCTTAPDTEAIDLYRSEGGTGSVHAGTKVCFMDDEQEAMETVLRLWPNEGLPGELAQVLPTPAHFEQACELVTAEHIKTPVGPDIDKHVASLQQYADAGVDELFVQQIGPNQDAFFTTWASEVLPRLSA